MGGAHHRKLIEETKEKEKKEEEAKIVEINVLNDVAFG